MPPAEPHSSRRKLRKGTQSCWECKRRKMRCSFATPEDLSCISCRRRGTSCVSQEWPEEYHTAALGRGKARTEKGGKSIGDRMARVEVLMEKLIRKIDPEAESSMGQEERPLFVSDLQSPPVRDERRVSTKPKASVPSPQCPRSLLPVPSNSAHRPFNHSDTTSKYDNLGRGLYAAWPSSRDLDLLLNLPTTFSGLSHRIVLAPYSSDLPPETPSARDILQLPQPGSHPILLARKLLTLGLFLQVIPPSAAEVIRAQNPGFSCREIENRAVQAANRLVTSNDELIGSCVEGIECLLIESTYQAYAGNLRRAWLINRRAISVAQMMRLNHGSSIASPWVRILTDQTRERCDPTYMWFLMCHSELHLSLLLGLTPMFFDDNFASQGMLQSCSSIDAMERIHCVVAGKLLRRDRSSPTLDPKSTREIDALLQKAASSMPPSWWQATDAISKTDEITAMDHFHRFIQYADQLTHFYLLVQLHLPSLLRPSVSQADQYSRVAAMNASRGLLTSIQAYRRCYSIIPPCRGTHFFSLFGSAVMCIAHMAERHQQHQAVAGDDNAFDIFAHQTPGDRALMESIVESLEMHRDHPNNDVISCKVVGVLRDLLEAEDRAATGAIYHISTSAEAAEGDETVCGGKLSEDGRFLWLRLPCFETIVLEQI
ncbi:uncharacterized protein E0L32_006111 [Thyridium curvatum]|uniref:Zn(2)-C6 fungal-type domain-containing protein n=1 Tax=Thyridium curvatum TaxID=1093900 RepID=A0A507B8I4_9PEZI|nr:uncharacterized protein E0L32_006111 [Thyridium curvatum]TPX13381.1 hypothetical protein E0L32_006111 [Thyridium curvatum]